MVFGTTFSSQNLISETNKGELILKIDEGFYQFIKDPSNYGEINSDGNQNIKIYPGLGISDICAIDLFIANRSSNMFSNNSHNCLQRDLSDIDFISYTCLSENTIYDISLDNSFVEITIEYKANKLNKLNEILTNDASVNRNSSKLKFFNSPKIFNNALKINDYSKYLITPELNDQYNIPGRDLSGHFNNLIYYKSSTYEGDISTSLYIDDTSAEILTPVQLLNYKLLEIQEEASKEDPSKNVFFNTKNWGNYTHPLSGFHLGALAYNNLLYNDLSYDSNVFYNQNSGNYYDEQTYRKLTIPYMANKYVKRINDISLSIVNWYSDINLQNLTHAVNNPNWYYPDMSLIYNSDFNEIEQGSSVTNKDKNLLFNIDNEWQYICDICFTDISLYTEIPNDISDISYIYHEIKDNFFNIFNQDRSQPSKLIKWNNDSDFSCIKTKLGLSQDSIGRDCEIKIQYSYDQENENHLLDRYQRKINYFFKGYDLSSCFGFFNSEYNSEMFGQKEILGISYDISYLYNTGGDILSEPGLMECATSLNIDLCNQIHNSDNYDLCGGKINYKKKYGYTLSNFSNKDLRLGDQTWAKVLLNRISINGIWSFYTNNTRVECDKELEGHQSNIDTCILWKKVIDTYKEGNLVSDLKIKDVLHTSYIKYLKFMDKNFFSFNKWASIKLDENPLGTFTDRDLFYYKKAHITYNMDISNVTIDNIFEQQAFITIKVPVTTTTRPSSTHQLNEIYNYNETNFEYHNIDNFINDISNILNWAKGRPDETRYYPIFNSPYIINKYISGSIIDFFRYIEFVNRRGKLNNFALDGYDEFRITSNEKTNMNSFPFLILGYNYNTTTKSYQINVTTENTTIIERNQKANYIPKIKVYARKARQDINTKKLLDIKEFDKIPLFLYKDPFVNNHHQIEITSKTIPTIYPALTCDVSSIGEIDNSNQIYNKINLEEIYLTIDFTNSTNNLNNRFLSNFKTQLNKNNELLYFAQQNKNSPPIKFKIRNSNYDDFPYYFGTNNSYNIVNGQYSTIINDLFSFNLPRFQYRPIYETINTNILSILNCNNNPDFSTNFGNKHFENLLAINNNKLPPLNEEKYTYKLIDYSDNSIYNLKKIYKYDAIDLFSYSYFTDINLNDNSKINILEAFNDICTNYYDMSLINYMNNKNSRKIDNFPLYQNISIKIDINDYTSTINDASNYKLDLQLWDVSNMFIDLSNKYQIDFSNINCKGLNIFSLTQDISINNDWDYIYSEKLLRSRDFSFSTSVSIIDLSFSINITELSNSNLSMTINNFLDFSYNLYNSTTNSTISNESIYNLFILNFNYLTSRDNSENLNYYLNNVKNLHIIDNPDRNLLENYNNDNLNNFNMKMFDFETLHPKIHSNIINDNSKIDICPESFLNFDLFFENNFNLYDSSYNYYKINNTQDPNYLDMSNSKLNISELFEYKMFSSNNLIQDISKSIETFNFTPFTKKFINDISFYFSDNINYIYSNKYSPLNINVINDLIPNVNLIDNNKVVYKNTILLPKDASNLFTDLNFDKINYLMNFTKTNNCDKMFKNTLSLYDNRLLKFSAFNNFNNNILLNEMFMNSSINYFPYLLINSLKNIPNTIKIEAKDIITNCNNMYLNEYFLAIRSFSEVLDFNNNLKYTDTNFTNVEISWNLTNNKYFGGLYPLDFDYSNEKEVTIDNSLQLIVSLDSEKGIYWDYYINYSSNIFNCTNKLDLNKIPTNQNYWLRLLRKGNSYEDLCLNIYRCNEQLEFFKLGYNFLRGFNGGFTGGDLYWSIGFLLKILGFTDLSNQTHYNKPISLNSKYEQRRKFLKEKMYKHNNIDQILDWYGVDDICCGQFDNTSMSSYINNDYSLNVINLFYLFPETSYCWLDLSINLSYRDIYYEDHFVNKIVKPNKTLDIYKNDPFYRYDTAYDYASKVILSNNFFYLSWLEKYAINTLNKGLNYNDSPVFRYIYINSFAAEMLDYIYKDNELPVHISDIMINVKLNNSDQSFVLIDNSICELFNIFELNNNFIDQAYEQMWFQDGSGIYTSLGNRNTSDTTPNTSYPYDNKLFKNIDNSLINPPGHYTINSKKFPFYHYTNEDISNVNNNNDFPEATKKGYLNAFRVSKLCTGKLHESNANFWIKIDLGFILNKLYPHEFKSKTIPLDRINYMYFFEGYTYDNWAQAVSNSFTDTNHGDGYLNQGKYSKKSTNLTYILSNINYSSLLEHDINDQNNYYNMYMSILKPGYLNNGRLTSSISYFTTNSSNFNNRNYTYRENMFGEETVIGEERDILSYNYKVINCNECNLFSYINGFPKDLNTQASASGVYRPIFIGYGSEYGLKARETSISKNTKIGILIKGNTDFSDEIIYTEISNNIAPQNNLKHNQSDRIFNDYSDISNNTIRFDYLPYNNREQYENREIRNYFIENYSNIGKIDKV